MCLKIEEKTFNVICIQLHCHVGTANNKKYPIVIVKSISSLKQVNDNNYIFSEGLRLLNLCLDLK